MVKTKEPEVLVKKKTHIVIIGIIFLLCLIGIYISKNYKLPHFQGQIHYEERWNLKIGKTGYDKSVELPMTLDKTEANKYTLSTTLTYHPEEQDSPYAFLSMNHMYFKVYLDDKVIYSYMREDTPNLSKSPGNTYAMVPLPMDCQGKEFKIEFWTTLESGLVYALDAVEFGDYPTVMHEAFLDSLLHNIIVICNLFTGILLVIVSQVVLKRKISRDAWYIGMFTIVFSAYNLTENMFNLYMISNPYITYLLNFIVFACIPIPILLFFKSKVLRSYHKMYDIVYYLLWCNVAIQIILHFLKIKDIRQLLLCTHILYVCVFVLIFISILKTSQKEYAKKRMLIYSIIPILLGITIDAILYYSHTIIKRGNTFFLQLGVLCFLLLQAKVVLKNIMTVYRENIEAELYKSLAFKDGLTGAYNRTAYNREIEIIYENKAYNTLICMCVDINNLKQINDRNGHEAGDSVICDTSRFLHQYFQEFGKIFRVGGDEFTVILYDIDELKLKLLICNMYLEIEEYNKNASIIVDFALGYKEFSDSDFQTIEQCISYADKEMYAMKERNR